MLRQRIFLTTVNFEKEYFLNKETDGVLTDTQMNFHDWHLTWLSQLQPNVKVGQSLVTPKEAWMWRTKSV